MANPFGSKFTYDPIPKTIHLELVGREKSGKSSFLAHWAKPGIVAVIDADGRFSDVVPQNSKSEFYPISDKQADMIDVESIVRILDNAISKIGDSTSMIAIDTLTKILDPIVMNIQNKKGVTTVYDWADKAKAMKQLRIALNKWDCETCWVYHKKEYYKKISNNGKTEYILDEKSALSDIEYSRLGADITLSLEIKVDEKGKRGAYVKEARGGRVGFTYWDESGSWENIREELEKAIWGGLTKEQQVSLTNERDVLLTSPEQAKRWAWNFSEGNGNFFKDAAHCQNAYEKLKGELVTEYTEQNKELTPELFFAAWKEEVFQRELLKKEELNNKQ